MVVQTVCSFSVVVNKAAEWSKTENKNHGDWRRQIVIKLISYRRFTESPSPSETPREHVTSQFGSRLFSYYFPRFLFFRFMALVSACWLDNMCSICLTLRKRSVSLSNCSFSFCFARNWLSFLISLIAPLNSLLYLYRSFCFSFVALFPVPLLDRTS